MGLWITVLLALLALSFMFYKMIFLAMGLSARVHGLCKEPADEARRAATAAQTTNDVGEAAGASIGAILGFGLLRGAIRLIFRV